MTLGRCPLNIFCCRGTPATNEKSVEPTNPESITTQNGWRAHKTACKATRAASIALVDTATR